MPTKTTERVCEECNGVGVVQNRYGARIRCGACHGTGKHTLRIETEVCPHCGGAL